MKLPYSGMVLLAFLAGLNAQDTPKHSVVREQGFVPDAVTATRIAEAVLIPIYGWDRIEGEKPLNAALTNQTWTVTGSMPKWLKGGVVTVELSKIDARILRISHGK